MLWGEIYIKLNKQDTVTQMNEGGIRKIIFLARPEGKRGTGRPKMRWVDSVDQKGEKTGERNRKRRARNRDKWEKSLRKFGTQPGLSGR
jgi:hypothetical protein